MTTRYLADIQDAAEHRELQRLIKLYPAAAYEQWCTQQAREIERLVARRHEVRLVAVTAAEFADYCARTGAQRDIGAFTGFLWDKGKRLKGRVAVSMQVHAGMAR